MQTSGIVVNKALKSYGENYGKNIFREENQNYYM